VALGGSGGGGNGGRENVNPAATAGTVNLGAGGGGGAGNQGIGAQGGSGIVIISYPSTNKDLVSIGGGLTYTKTTSGSNTIYKFTAGTGDISW
jgi:hypothetical protein